MDLLWLQLCLVGMCVFIELLARNLAVVTLSCSILISIIMKAAPFFHFPLPRVCDG